METPIINSTKQVSLTSFLIVVMLVATITSMAAFAVGRYVLLKPEGHSVTALVVEQAWNVVVLGVIMFPVLYVVLHRHVVVPIHALYEKFYAITRGDLAPVQLTSRIVEIQEIVDGINLVLKKIAVDTSATAIVDLAEHARMEITRLMEDQGSRLTPAGRGRLASVVDELENVTREARTRVHAEVNGTKTR